MTGYTWTIGRVVDGVQLVDVTLHQFDENDYQGRILQEPIPQTPALIDGQIVDAGDGVRAILEAEQRAAYVASCVPLFGAATLYRIALRRNFGDGAETNRDISQAYALAYFGQKVAASTITPQETADSALMMALFPILAAATPDGTTWTFPWEAVP